MSEKMSSTNASQSNDQKHPVTQLRFTYNGERLPDSIYSILCATKRELESHGLTVKIHRHHPPPKWSWAWPWWSWAWPWWSWAWWSWA